MFLNKHVHNNTYFENRFFFLSYDDGIDKNQNGLEIINYSQGRGKRKIKFTQLIRSEWTLYYL